MNAPRTNLSSLELLTVVEGMLAVPHLMGSMPCTRPLLRDAAARFRKEHGMQAVSYDALASVASPANDAQAYDRLLDAVAGEMGRTA